MPANEKYNSTTSTPTPVYQYQGLLTPHQLIEVVLTSLPLPPSSSLPPLSPSLPPTYMFVKGPGERSHEGPPSSSGSQTNKERA